MGVNEKLPLLAIIGEPKYNFSIIVSYAEHLPMRRKTCFSARSYAIKLLTKFNTPCNIYISENKSNFIIDNYLTIFVC